MKRRHFIKTLVAAPLGWAAAGSPGGSFARAGTRGGRRLVSPYAGVDWDTAGSYRAGLHMHTLQSDGWHPVKDVVQAYRAAGFDILSITDHDWNYPNFRPDRDDTVPRTPYPRDPKPANFPANTTWPWTDYGAAAPEDAGLAGIEGNELTFRHHICSYFCSYGVWYERTGREAPYGGIVDGHGNEVWEHDQLDAVARDGGLAVLCHPGVENHHNWWERKPLEWYAEHFERHPADCLVGLEVTNCSAATRAYDEGLWDQLLARFMPRRPVWGFGVDDMHRLQATKQTFTVFYLPECSPAGVRRAMETGRFCFTKSTRGMNYLDGRPLDVFPALERVTVDPAAGMVRLNVRDCDDVKWITAPETLEPLGDYRTHNAPYAPGKTVHTGPELDFRMPEIRGYVRAECVRRADGQEHALMTNPFGILPA